MGRNKRVGGPPRFTEQVLLMMNRKLTPRCLGKVLPAWLVPCLLLSALPVSAAVAEPSSRIYERHAQEPLQPIYDRIRRELEESRFYVIYELNIGKNLARNAERWGDEYNRNRFQEVRAMVICNPWFANQVLNLAPNMMALCPLTLSFLQREGQSTILFDRLSSAGVGSAVEDLLWETENRMIYIIEAATPNGRTVSADVD